MMMRIIETSLLSLQADDSHPLLSIILYRTASSHNPFDLLLGIKDRQVEGRNPAPAGVMLRPKPIRGIPPSLSTTGGVVFVDSALWPD
jgi:hypothetical protein